MRLGCFSPRPRPAPAPPPSVDSVGGRPHAEGPPNGHTGGFGEPTCQACHSEAELNPPGGIVGIEGIPARYEPGQRYPITVVLVSEGMGKAGFQAAFRFAGGDLAGRQAGRIAPVDDRSAVRIDPNTGIEYVQHSRLGSEIADETVVSWQFVWTAPTVGGRRGVIIHVAANSGNGDNSPFGDFIYTTEAATEAQSR